MKKEILFSLSLLLIPVILQAQDDVIKYEIVKQEFQKKAFGTYTLEMASCAIEGKNLTKDQIKDTLNEIIAKLRERDGPDAITVLAYKTAKEARIGGLITLAQAEWWPKGHSLEPANAENIENKNSYEFNYVILDTPSIPAEKIVSRYSKDGRKKIYFEFLLADILAEEEAEKNYPINADSIPASQLANYNWKLMAEAHKAEANAIDKRLEKKIAKKYGISDIEIKMIKEEAMSDHWPWPDKANLIKLVNEE